ncbi:MAG: iron-sulfur cluster assembly accessory protein, partial [Nitrospira sp.]|nr:iron-sulfur cluster assembly accessory protein [Nitrospira sp.]
MITVTEIARKKVIEFIEKSGQPMKGLRVIAEAKSPLNVNYRLALIGEEQTQPDDTVVKLEGFNVYIDPKSADYLQEATLDFVDNFMSNGFKIDAPKKLP